MHKVVPGVSDLLVQGVATIALIVSLAAVFRVRKRLADTTLITAHTWLSFAVTAWTVAAIADWWLPSTPQQYNDQLWYFAGILMLCPAIAVLGARKPGSRVWNWFVLLPLVLVLGLPAFSQFQAADLSESLQVEPPTLIGFAVVAVMGYGNYVGTRFTLTAVLASTALLTLLPPTLTEPPSWLPTDDTCRVAATLVYCLAVLLAFLRHGGQATNNQLAVDRVWGDFRNQFGIVWSNRIQERVNQAAEKEKWLARLESSGFVWQTEASEQEKAATLDRIDQTLRWLLRRFVDPAWLDARLDSES